METPESRKNWFYALFHGLFYSLKRRLAPPKVFLPFICIAAGAPVFLSAMIVPVYRISSHGAELMASPFVSGARQRKHYVSSAIAAIAAGLLLAILAIELALPMVTTICLILAAIVIGIGRGVGGLAYATLLPSLFDKRLRGHLLNLEGVLGACAAIGIALAAYYILRGSDPLRSHVVLIWLAVLVAVPAALLLFPIDEPVRNAALPETGKGVAAGGKIGAGALQKFALCWRKAWFRQYLVMCLLLLSVREIMPFYTIHAASLHKDESGALAVFVIAMSVGTVLSGPLLYRLTSETVGSSLSVSILTAMAAGAIALSIETFLSEPKFYYYLPVFMLIALAGEIATVSLNIYLGEVSEEDTREFYVATSHSATGVIGVAVAAVLGLAAHVHDEVVPIAAIFSVNLLALLYVLWSVPATRTQPL